MVPTVTAEIRWRFAWGRHRYGFALCIWLGFACAPAFAQGSGSVEVRSSLARIYEEPRASAEVVDLAYGNDAFPVEEQRLEWVRVRLRNGSPGWLRARDVNLDSVSGSGGQIEPLGEADELLQSSSGRDQGNLLALSLENAITLRSAGYSADARDKFVKIMLSYPETEEAFLATWYLNRDHRLDDLPLPDDQGQFSPEVQERLRALRGPLLIREGRLRVVEQRYLPAVVVLEQAYMLSESKAEALIELRRALDAFLKHGFANRDREQVGLAVGMLRHYFPKTKIDEKWTAFMGQAEPPISEAERRKKIIQEMGFDPDSGSSDEAQGRHAKWWLDRQR